MGRIILATFGRPADAESALFELEHFGMHPVEVSFEEATRRWEERQEVVGKSAVAGATSGAAVGVIAGVLAATGIAEGLAGVFVGGMLATGIGLHGVAAVILTGLLTGLLAGLVLGVLTGLLLPREYLRESSRLSASAIGIGILDEEEISREAFLILERHGALKMGMADLTVVQDQRPETKMDEVPTMRRPVHTPNRMVFGERRPQRPDIDSIRPRR